MATASTRTGGKSEIGEIYSRLGHVETDMAVMQREMGEVKEGQGRLEGTMSQHGELLNAIRSDLKVNRFPGIGNVVKSTLAVGALVGMLVTAITYITSHFIGAELGPKITGLEKEAIIMEYRMKLIEPSIARLALLERQSGLLHYRMAQLEKSPRLMMRPATQ